MWYKCKGFTLLEVLVAMTIMGIIMVLVHSTTSSILDAKDRISERDVVFQMGRVALRKLSDDVSVAFLMRKTPRSPQTPQGGQPPPARTTPRPTTFFIGEDRGNRDSLRLTTLSHLRRFRNARESEQSRVRYQVVPSPDDPDRYQLIRDVVTWLDDTTNVDGKPLVLADGVIDFELEYYDVRKEEWVREWDSEKTDWRERLPDAVRVTLVLVDPENEKESIVLTTASRLALSLGPIDL